MHLSMHACVCVCVGVCVCHPNLNTQTCHSMMMPSADFRDAESSEFQAHFVQCGGLKLLLDLLVDKNFLVEADTSMKRLVFLP